MTLPVRSAVLNELYVKGSVSVEQTMRDLQKLYGTERQFTKPLFIEHFMSLAANGLAKMDKYELGSDGELNLYYTITEQGKEIAQKYIPHEYHS